METLDKHIGFISNREVLDLLLDEQRTQAAAIHALKDGRRKLEDSHRGDKANLLPAWDEGKEIGRLLAPENVRSVQVQAIEFLQDTEYSTVRQTSQGVATLTSELGKFEPSLTKLEKLQLVNMTPAYEPELIAMVDNTDARIGDRVPELLELIQSHLSAPILPSDALENEAEVKHEAEELARKSKKEARANLEAQEEQEEMMEDEDMEDDELVGAARGPAPANADVELDEVTGE